VRQLSDAYVRAKDLLDVPYVLDRIEKRLQGAQVPGLTELRTAIEP
jgi:hypothetical protein